MFKIFSYCAYSTLDIISLSYFNHANGCLVVQHCGFQCASSWWLIMPSIFSCVFKSNLSLSLVEFLFKSFINFSWIAFILTLFLLMHSLESGHLGIKTVFQLLSTYKPCVFSLVLFHWLGPPRQYRVEVLRVDRLGFPLILGENIWCFNIKHNSS